jgi:beta-lactamase regulating signal transducer with metallopeptidase domain
MPAESEIRPECLSRFRTLEEKCLFGNGQKSHAERLATLERADETKTWLLRTILGAVLVDTIGILALVVRSLLK